MTKDRADGKAIAKLLSPNGDTIGWAILWDNQELSVLWLDDDQAATDIDPPIDQRILSAAKSVTEDSVTALLETLSGRNES